MPHKMLSKLRAEKVALCYFLFAMLWILTSDYLLGLLIKDPALFVSISTYKGVLFVCTTALLLYLVLRVWFFSPSLRNQDTSHHESRRGLLLVFGGMALLVPLLSLSVIKLASPQALQSARMHLQMVAEMKVDYLDQWFAERSHLLDMIAMDRSLHQWVAEWSENSSTADEANYLTDYINRLHSHLQFDGIYLYHLGKQKTFASGSIDFSDDQRDQIIGQATNQQAAFFSGIHPTEKGASLIWVLPMYSFAENTQPTAIMMLSLNPETHLYPSLSQWPGDSYSAELFLMQNIEANRFTLLSPVKSEQHSVFSTIEYLSEAPKGLENQLVMSVVRPLTQVNWVVTAQQDRKEVMLPIYMMASWLGLLCLATVVSVMFALRLVWLQQRRLEQTSYQMQTAEKDQLLLKFFEMPFVGMAITDPYTGQWLQFNPELCRLLGYTETELKALTWQEVTHQDDLYIDQQAFDRLHRGQVDSYTLEKQFVRKNGAAFTALLNVGSVRYPNGKLQYCIATVQDITDQKRYESELMHQRDLYNTLSETNQTIIRSQNEDEVFAQVCRIAVVYGQLRYASILKSDGHRLKAVHCYGDRPIGLFSFDETSWFSLDRDNELETVIDTAEALVLNQLSDRGSKAYFPVRLDGKVIAVMLLSATDAEFFSHDVVSTLTEMADDIAFAIRFIQQEDALKAAVQVVEASPVVLFRWENRPGWPVSYVSSNVSRWGYFAEEFLSGSVDFNQLVHPEDRQWLKDEVTLFLSQKREEYLQEYRIQTREGDVLWVEDITKVAYQRDGEVKHIEGVVTDVTSRKSIQQRIEFLARHDALTSLPNRTDVLTNIETRGNTLTALLMLDLDRFKDVNDSFGHRVGDQLLCGVAELLRSVCPSDALLARFGGDEFGVLIDRHVEGLKEIALTLIDTLQTPIRLSDGMEIRIGACVGIAMLSEAEHRAEELLRQADAALYKAKEAGRGQYCFYTSELTQAALVRLNTEALLREAIIKGELSVYFQPQIDIASGKLIGAEALLRWESESSFIPPDIFIPVAEQSGLIHPIGEWVMDQVCQAGKRWLDKGYPAITLAVNLSSFQLRHGNLVDMIQNILQKYQYPAEFLEVELTESALMRREDEAEKIFEVLQDMGVSLAIDDFGTGYSSLSYLKNFPLNVLKIDKTFIQDLESNKNDREITAAIIAMGHTLGLKILAEGVETDEQLMHLKALGCDYYQGYLTSPAITMELFEQRFLASMASS